MHFHPVPVLTSHCPAGHVCSCGAGTVHATANIAQAIADNRRSAMEAGLVIVRKIHQGRKRGNRAKATTPFKARVEYSDLHSEPSLRDETVARDNANLAVS
jgi:hypothetical protein